MQRHALLLQCHALPLLRPSSERNLGSIEGAGARALQLRLTASPRRCARLSRLRHLAGALALPAAGWLRRLAQLLRRCSRVSRCRHIAPQLSMQRWSLPGQFHSLLSQRSVLSVQLRLFSGCSRSSRAAGALPRNCPCSTPADSAHARCAAQADYSGYQFAAWRSVGASMLKRSSGSFASSHAASTSASVALRATAVGFVPVVLAWSPASLLRSPMQR
jgi:hypothetical protein